MLRSVVSGDSKPWSEYTAEEGDGVAVQLLTWKVDMLSDSLVVYWTASMSVWLKLRLF